MHVKIHTLILSYFSLLQKTLKGLSVQSMHNTSFNILNNPLRFSNNINLIFTVKKTEVQEIKELVTGSEPIQSGFRAYTCNQVLDTDTANNNLKCEHPPNYTEEILGSIRFSTYPAYTK